MVLIIILIHVNEKDFDKLKKVFSTLGLEFQDKRLDSQKVLKNGIPVGNSDVSAISSDEEETLIFDEKFMTVNMMNKTHINNYTPIETCEESMVNLFYIVTNGHKEKDGMVYDLISSRYESTPVSEEKLKMMFTMGLISGGAKFEDGKVVLASMTKDKKEKQYEEVKKQY